MEISNYKEEVHEHFELFDKYLKKGDKEKARECLKQISTISNEVWECEQNKIAKLCEDVGISYEDL